MTESSIPELPLRGAFGCVSGALFVTSPGDYYRQWAQPWMLNLLQEVRAEPCPLSELDNVVVCVLPEANCDRGFKVK